MLVPVPSSLVCPIDARNPLVQILHDSLYLVRATLRAPRADNSNEISRDLVIRAYDDEAPVIVEADGSTVLRFAPRDITNMTALARADSRFYAEQPRLDAEWRRTVSEIAASQGNPFKLVQGFVAINSEALRFTHDGYLREDVVAFRPENGPPFDARRVEMMVRGDTMEIVSCDGRITASMPQRRIVGVGPLAPQDSRHYQEFRP